MAEHEEDAEEVLAMDVTAINSTVEQSRTYLVLGEKSDSGEYNQLQTESVQKTLEGIDQFKDSIEDNIQDFSEGMPPSNTRFTEETQ